MADDAISLLEHVDIMQLNCLDEVSEHTLSGIVAQKKINTTSSYLLSDADEQLLLTIPFHQTVRVRSIIIRSSGGDIDQAPKRVKLLVNRPAIGFEDADGEEPEVAQILDLTEDDVKNGRPIPLRFVRFQGVNSLHIFVVSNQGGADETRIDAVDVLGMTQETTKDLKGLKQQEE
ncbi:DUF1000-domain-containing protein [Favolaschia claudopus]|uniref:DUF1000-domain-containing protein n=1 Tax=Favolaschia claudopus TaxID=2862362 RepID=A0AAW0APV6_9AGAR